MPHEIIGVSQCRICGVRITGGTVGALIQPGAAAAELQRAQASVTKLYNHAKTHIEQRRAISLHAGAFEAFMVLSLYETTDPAVLKQRDEVRWNVHRQTMVGGVSDTKLHNQALEFVGSLANGSGELHAAIVAIEPRVLTELAEAVQSLLRSLRDALEQPGKYPELPPITSK